MRAICSLWSLAELIECNIMDSRPAVCKARMWPSFSNFDVGVPYLVPYDDIRVIDFTSSPNAQFLHNPKATLRTPRQHAPRSAAPLALDSYNRTCSGATWADRPWGALNSAIRRCRRSGHTRRTSGRTAPRRTARIRPSPPSTTRSGAPQPWPICSSGMEVRHARWSSIYEPNF